MGQRRILVLGSQCKALGRLSFLPAAAQDLYATMIDPNLGGCKPALSHCGLILDPPAHEARRAIREAYKQALVWGV
jgi:hypothetical protein